MRPLALLLIGLAGTLPLAAEEHGAEALLAVVGVERAMLDDTLERFESLSRRETDLRGELNVLRDALEAALREEEGPDHRRVSQVASQLDRAEAERAELLHAERLLLDRITAHLQRLELYEQELETLEARSDEDGMLTGTWDLTLMPAQQRGSASLTQTGAVINGTYRLDGGWSGSLQGTLVNRKVFLVRIDSKLGKSMELEGFLSADGDRIRGSWLNFELAGGEGATGQWTATRRDESR